jgi:hypothetical protein
MEHMTIASFLRHGHSFHLYVYQPPSGIPEGTVVLDANEILPAARIFKYRDHDTFAGFANFFRYKLLLERGGWWVDTDMLCLKPFRFPAPYVFSSEVEAGKPKINNGAMHAPPGSPVFKRAWEICETLDPGKLKWTEAGPLLMSRCVEECGLQQFVQPPEVFCPIDYTDWETVLNPSRQHQFPERTHAVHLWNELWRRARRDKNARYHPKCLYESFKNSYVDRNLVFPPAPRTPGAAGRFLDRCARWVAARRA